MSYFADVGLVALCGAILGLVVWCLIRVGSVDEEARQRAVLRRDVERWLEYGGAVGRLRKVG